MAVEFQPLGADRANFVILLTASKFDLGRNIQKGGKM
jgi:hypothetical protein